MLNDHCHRVSTHLQSINIIVIIIIIIITEIIKNKMEQNKIKYSVQSTTVPFILVQF